MQASAKRQAWRFLVMGCGSIGKRHLGNLLAARAGEVTAFDVRTDRAEEVRSRFGMRTFTDLDEAFRWEPNVAFITAPTSLHISLAMRAAEHGCHLFIEKPLSHSRADVGRLLEAVQRKQLVTLVGCNMRFHPGLQEIKRQLDREEIGKVVAARIQVGQYLPDWHPHEDYRQGYSARHDLGGGVVLDAIHEIDYVQWLLGPVRSVVCFSGKLSHLEIQTNDVAALLLRFEGGAIGEVHLDYIQRTYSRSCHIIGDEGTIRWDYSAGTVRIYQARLGAWDTMSNPAGWEANQMYVDELAHFLRCLAGEEQPALDVFAGARVLDVALAAEESATSNRIITLGNAL